jgi:hypothetical protein
MEQMVPSRVAVEWNADEQTFDGETANVARLALHSSSDWPIRLTLDGQPLGDLALLANGETVWLERKSDSWNVTGPPTGTQKGRNRNGTFNAVIDNNVLLIYGTQGSEAEDRWAESKARYDAETFYYRGGGALEVVDDTRFEPNQSSNRNVVLYGNADTNSAWQALLADSPVEVKRGQIRVGERTETGDDLAVLLIMPRPGSDTALVGVVGGTGLAGMQLTNRLRWYVSGITYPDLMIFDPKVLVGGVSDLRAAGYFGPSWGIDDAEIVWSDGSQ